MQNGVQLRVTHPGDGDQRLDRVRAAVGVVVDTDDHCQAALTYIEGLTVGVLFIDPAVTGVFEHTMAVGEDAEDAIDDLVTQITAAAISGITPSKQATTSLRIARAGAVASQVTFYAVIAGAQNRKPYLDGTVWTPLTGAGCAYAVQVGSYVRMMSTAAGTTAAQVATALGATKLTENANIVGEIVPMEFYNPASGIIDFGVTPGVRWSFTCSVVGGNLAITKSVVIADGPDKTKQGVWMLGVTDRRLSLLLQNLHATIDARAAFGAAATHNADWKVFHNNAISLNARHPDELHVNLTDTTCYFAVEVGLA